MPVTPEAMAALRLRGDELADATVDALFAAGEVGHFNTLMRWFERSGDPLMIAGYIGTGSRFAECLARFGVAYANQTEKDWQELRKSGRAGKATATKTRA